METKLVSVSTENPDEAVISEAAKVLKNGGLVAFPTETVYGLGGNGLDPEASAKIYAAKGRPSDNPLILHISSIEELAPLVEEIPPMAEPLMEACWPGPMTLIFKKSEIVPKATTGGLDTVAIRYPSHPVAMALIRKCGFPIAAPSANTSGHPSPTGAAHVANDLSGKIDMIIDGGDVEIGLESTIIDVTGDSPVILRPGYISLEEVRRLMGEGELDPAITGIPSPDLRPKAPGMKYRHYAPKAEVTIFEGEEGAVAARINALAAESIAAGRSVGILCAEESRKLYTGGAVKCLGSRKSAGQLAHNLYRALREFDDEAAEVVYSESFAEGELGCAIMNRLNKAAGYRIVKV